MSRLLGAADQTIKLTERISASFTDARNPAFVEHDVETLVMQRIVGIALAYEDLVDHDDLRLAAASPHFSRRVGASGLRIGESSSATKLYR